MKKKAIISTVIAGTCTITLCAFCFWYNRFELKQDTFQVEYGTALNMSPAAYIDSNQEVKKDIKLDLSKVDMNKVGNYAATATYVDRELKFTINVEDTTPPEVKLKKDIKGIAGKAIAGVDLIEAAEDKAGIKSITFAEAGQGEYKSDLKEISLKYDKPGTYNNTVTVTDNNGVKAEQDFTIKVVEDYEKHVSGIKDLTVEQDSKIDWLKEIEKDEKISEVTADDSKVDLSKTGEYDLTYTIIGDDKETKIDKKIKVTVVSPSKAQELANDGKTVKTTNGNKQKYVPPVQSSGSAGSYNGSYSSGSSSGNSSGGGYSGGSASSSSAGDSGNSSGSGSSGGGSWLDGLTPGQSWDSEPSGDKHYFDGPDGNYGQGYEPVPIN